MQSFLQVLVIAILSEAIWENLKMIWQDGKLSADRIGALIIGIIVAIVTNVDVFSLLDFDLSIPIVGCVLTGILISRGANVVHDVLEKIESLND